MIVGRVDKKVWRVGGGKLAVVLLPYSAFKIVFFNNLRRANYVYKVSNLRLYSIGRQNLNKPRDAYYILVSSNSTYVVLRLTVKFQCKNNRQSSGESVVMELPEL